MQRTRTPVRDLVAHEIRAAALADETRDAIDAGHEMDPWWEPTDCGILAVAELRFGSTEPADLRAARRALRDIHTASLSAHDRGERYDDCPSCWQRRR